MAETRTEQPTPKKLREARERGQVPRSRDVSTVAVLAGTAAGLALAAEPALESLGAVVRISFGAVGRPADPTAVLAAGLALGARAVAPVLAFAVVAGAAGAFLQVGPLLSIKPVMPQAERLDPVKGLKNLLGGRQWIELARAVLKMAIIGAVAADVLHDSVRGVTGLAARDAAAAVVAGGDLVLSLVLRVAGAMALLAVLDLLYQRWRHRQDLRMTKEEVKREHREAEGDPLAKQHRERMHRELVEHSALEQVRRADVLVVNPTHLAVALRYDEEEHEAPEVLAKGMDHLAERMIAAAREAGVPILRDVPLAHALFDLEVGDEIPDALYEAVAAVLRAAWREREAEEAGGR
jgi:flagellar biosynthesis protein FlhB